MIGAIARALRLTLDERDHLLQLAGHTAAAARARARDHVTPALLRVLDRLDTPAQVVSDLGVTLAPEPARGGAARRADALTGRERSVFYRWFTDPARARAAGRRRTTSGTRARYVGGPAGRRTGAIRREARELIDALLRRQRGVRARVGRARGRALAWTTRKRIAHPRVGLIELDCQILTAENQTERLVVFTAKPGTEDAERLALLRGDRHAVVRALESLRRGMYQAPRGLLCVDGPPQTSHLNGAPCICVTN